MKQLLMMLIMFSLFSCTSYKAYLNKSSAQIIQKINDADNSESQEKIRFFFKIENEITQEQKQEIESMGIKLLSFKGTILSAEGNSTSIKKLAELDLVKSIELSGIAKPTN